MLYVISVCVGDTFNPVGVADCPNCCLQFIASRHVSIASPMPFAFLIEPDNGKIFVTIRTAGGDSEVYTLQRVPVV